MTSSLSKTTFQKLLNPAGLHCTTSERSGASLHSTLHNFLSRPLSFLDCNALLAGLPSCTIKPLQMIQNAAAWLVFSEPKRAHVTPLFVSLHWLPVAARIKFKTLMLAYRTATGSAPAYFHSLMTIYIPWEAWDLQVSDASGYHHREAQNHFPERFHSPFLAGGMNFPPLSGMLSPWQISSDTWKLISSVFTWLLLLHKKESFCSLSLTSPCLARFALNNAWNVVWQALPMTVCLFIMYRLLYSSIVSRFG